MSDKIVVLCIYLDGPMEDKL